MIVRASIRPATRGRTSLSKPQTRGHHGTASGADLFRPIASPPPRAALGKLLYAYAAASYALFAFSLLWLVAFVGNLGVPKTIDVAAGTPAPWGRALVVDVALVALFSLQHSVMARPAFKRAWTRIVPPAIERATYVFASTVVLLAWLALWEPLPAVVWKLDSTAARLPVWGLFWLGWFVVVTSPLIIDHGHLFGLKQAAAAMTGEIAEDPIFKRQSYYRLVRHPLMVGFLLAFWAAPTMTVGHLVFALASTGYILVGVYLEERDLRASLGEAYATYQREVRMLVPIPRGRR